MRDMLVLSLFAVIGLVGMPLTAVVVQAFSDMMDDYANREKDEGLSKMSDAALQNLHDAVSAEVWRRKAGDIASPDESETKKEV